MKVWVAIAVFVMLVLHQDVWFWDSHYLILGFMPVGLAYHAGYSIAAALLWALAIKFAWPEELEKFAEEGVSEAKVSDEGAASE